MVDIWSIIDLICHIIFWIYISGVVLYFIIQISYTVYQEYFSIKISEKRIQKLKNKKSENNESN